MSENLMRAIDQYFIGGRNEMIVILSVVAIFLAAAFLLLKSGEPFARGLSYPLIASALIFASVAIPLLIRDAPKHAELEAQLKKDPTAARAGETLRIQKVITTYPLYRYIYIFAIIVALLLFIFVRARLWQGVALGLLFFAAKGFVIDHYSEARARLYLSALQSND